MKSFFTHEHPSIMGCSHEGHIFTQLHSAHEDQVLLSSVNYCTSQMSAQGQLFHTFSDPSFDPFFAPFFDTFFTEWRAEFFVSSLIFLCYSSFMTKYSFWNLPGFFTDLSGLPGLRRLSWFTSLGHSLGDRQTQTVPASRNMKFMFARIVPVFLIGALNLFSGLISLVDAGVAEVDMVLMEGILRRFCIQ